ncbi:MAG: 5'-methylthioadenosine/S-adenosylhomocysteine nucleosidase [Bryobacteraceae bacterium]
MPSLIVCPMNKERDVLLQTWSDADFRPQRGVLGRLDVWRVPELNTVVSAGGIGKPQFALQTQHLLDALGVCPVMICAGTGGALARNLSIGDVVIATETVEHDRKGRFFPKPPPRFAGSPAAIRRFQTAVPHGFRLHWGPVASGDEDVVDAAQRRDLQRSTGAVAVGWEGAGGARACAFSGVAFVEIRGITDIVDPAVPPDIEPNLGPAMANVARILAQWCRAAEIAG